MNVSRRGVGPGSTLLAHFAISSKKDLQESSAGSMSHNLLPFVYAIFSSFPLD